MKCELFIPWVHTHGCTLSSLRDFNNVMDQLPLTNKESFTARALLVGERIDLRALETTERLATAPLTISVRGGGIAVIFRYGVVIFFDVASVEQASFLAYLNPMVSKLYDEPEWESLDIHILEQHREGVEGNIVTLHNTDIERLQLVAYVLSKSVVLAHYETRLTQSFDRIEPFAIDLERRRQIGRKAKELLKYLGRVLIIEHMMIGRVEVGDKPELLWERPDLERLYIRLEDEFEIRERQLALERKLDLISKTAQTILDLLQNRRSLRVEWYIVILIIMEILLTLYEMFFRDSFEQLLH